jgi:hypothetical protein
MSSWMTAAWRPATAEALAISAVGTGVYEIRDPDGEVVDIDYAGAREPFGLRSALERALADDLDRGYEFRYEPAVLYMSRYVELVLDHKFRHDGQEPARLVRRGVHIPGRIRPE